jgi:N-acetylglutamate synthase-like GNAT family acetyltransferase
MSDFLQYGRSEADMRGLSVVNPPERPYLVESVGPVRTRPLRRRVLRPGQTDDELMVPFEEHPDARWFAVEVDGTIVGCAAVLPEARQGGPIAGWRVRAMATDPALRSMGVGTSLLHACAAYAVERTGSELWCTARTRAAGFYLERGFHSLGEPFDLHGLGPHVVMAGDPATVAAQTG